MSGERLRHRRSALQRVVLLHAVRPALVLARCTKGVATEQPLLQGAGSGYVESMELHFRPATAIPEGGEVGQDVRCCDHAQGCGGRGNEGAQGVGGLRGRVAG